LIRENYLETIKNRPSGAVFLWISLSISAWTEIIGYACKDPIPGGILFPALSENLTASRKKSEWDKHTESSDYAVCAARQRVSNFQAYFLKVFSKFC
jgi:hypothetical protein